MTFIKATEARIKAQRATIYTDEHGSTETRLGGSPAWRNNNPGNIRPSKYNKEQIGTAWGFAVFPSEAAGLRAMQSLLSRPLYAKLTLEKAIFKYAPPSDNNPSSAYATYVSKHAEVALTEILGSLTPERLTRLIRAMTKFESALPGTITHP
ncbi:MAG: hypothetical protein DI585_05050 [Pseudomonas fluorescens]|nr:MAG: hypothetical protein DI585_05050 [Pseudomonas fluorescens]